MTDKTPATAYDEHARGFDRRLLGTDKTPATEAGRRMMDYFRDDLPDEVPMWLGHILAIEAEAAAIVTDRWLDSITGAAEPPAPKTAYDEHARGFDRRLLRVAEPPALDADVLSQAFYNVTRKRMTLLPPWRDESIAGTVWAQSVTDGAEVAAEYARLTREETT